MLKSTLALDVTNPLDLTLEQPGKFVVHTAIKIFFNDWFKIICLLLVWAILFIYSLCGLSGRYFCANCTVVSGKEWVVPARILLNWDFKRYSVSKRAAIFLSEIQHHPLLDLKTLNPYLYLTVPEVADLQVGSNFTKLVYLSSTRCWLMTAIILCRN